MGGSADLTTVSAQAVGDIEISGSGTLNSETPPQSLSSPADDPYEILPIPPISSCDFSGQTNVRDDEVMTPGRYCGNLRVQGSNIEFEPGTYIIDGGDFNANAGSSFFGDEVTFIFTGDTAGDVGTITMNGLNPKPHTVTKLAATPCSVKHCVSLPLSSKWTCKFDAFILTDGGHPQLRQQVLDQPTKMGTGT